GFQKHFLRGLFDGDGCIYIKNERNVAWNIVGTPEICSGVYEILKQNNIPTVVRNRPYYSGPHASVVCSKASDILKIFNFLYDDSDKLFLARKYNKFLEIKIIKESLI